LSKFFSQKIQKKFLFFQFFLGLLNVHLQEPLNNSIGNHVATQFLILFDFFYQKLINTKLNHIHASIILDPQ
jgi:flagellin-specific chaperone FliS